MRYLSTALSCRVALITVDAVVNVVPHALVVGIRLTLGMAVRARENGVVRRIGVAGRAHAVGPAVVGWEPCVIEHRAQPRRCVVARLARSRETRCGMVRIIRRLIIGLMAAVTVRWQCRVVVVDVALRAGDGNVKASQRERGQVVIKRGRDPCGGVVADLTSCRQAGRRVRRGVGAVVVRHVTRRARRIGQIVVSVYVARRTGRVHVEARQGKPGGRVIKGCSQPRDGRVTHGTIDREAGLHVVGIGRAVVVRHVAQIARAAGQAVVVVDVALRALQARVAVGKGESN